MTPLCSRGAVVLLVSLMFCLCLSASAQNPHQRLMERAHPTPIADPQYNFNQPMVPLITGETVFPSLFTNSNMIIAEDDPLPVQNESSIAINPLNPQNLIGSAVDYRKTSTTKVYYSVDGGKTWENIDLGNARPGWRSSNDPSVAFDHLGRGYLCYGGFNREGGAQFGENGVFVSFTDDGGKTWPTTHVPVMIHTGQQTADSAFEDKYYVHADTATSSPYRGRLYIPWKRVINSDSSTGIVIARSTDRGLSWLEPVAVSDRFPGTSEDTTFGQSFPLARTGPDGSVHLVWNSGTESSVRYARSTDGGDTWTEPRIVHTYQPFGNKSEVAGQVNSRVKGVVRAEAYPTLTIDNTGGPNAGNLYLCWSADQVPSIYFSRSTDNGDTWSDPVTVHSDDRNDQFWPWIALDPTNGDVAVMYFDSRDDAENILVNAYVSLSTDGGQTWVDRRVGDDQNDLRRNPFTGNTFAGDYNGCDFYGGMVYPSWVDMRNTTEDNMSDNDVFTAIVNVQAPAAPDRFAATTIANAPTEIDLSWSGVSERSFGQPLTNGEAMFVLKREGQIIAELPLGTLTFRDSGLEQYREYFYTLVVADATDTSAVRTASAFAGGSRAPGIPTIVNVLGNDPGNIEVRLTLPTKRLDGVTPLVNLSGIEIVHGNAAVGFTASAFETLASDTGRTVTSTTQSVPRGWYQVAALVVDSNGNRSPLTDTVWVYTGNARWTLEDFTDAPPFRIAGGSWARTPAFAYSQPASFTESPDGDYRPSQRDTVYLYPREMTKDQLRISWRVAAFVHESDTMSLESAKTFDGPWDRIAWWNASQDVRWEGAPGDDAWRWGAVNFSGALNDTTYLRLVFRSNVVRNADGFYIDDLTIDELTSVEESDAVISLGPQPATTHAVAGLQSEAPVDRCWVVALDGSRTDATWTQQGQNLVIDVRSLPSGVYTLQVQQGRIGSFRALHVFR